jgi:hypothetical protein
MYGRDRREVDLLPGRLRRLDGRLGVHPDLFVPVILGVADAEIGDDRLHPKVRRADHEIEVAQGRRVGRDDMDVDAQPVRRALIERTERARNDISAAAKVDIAKATPLLEWILPIEPSTPREVFLHSQMARLAMEMTQQRAQLMTRENAYGIQPVMMILLIVWLTVLFLATGLYAPANRTMIVALGIGAVAFSSALLLVLEQDRPFHGLLPVSAAPLDEALRAIRTH